MSAFCITIINMIKYTEEQRKLIEQNLNVVRCNEHNITFKKEFKIKVAKEYLEGKTSFQIWRDAGFDLNLIGKQVPKVRTRTWKRIYESKGEVGLLKDGRGKGGKQGRPKTKGLTEKEKIKYLEAQVEYLKAENVFLAKLRAKKKAE